MSEYTYVEKPFLDQLRELKWDVIDQGQGIPQKPALSLRESFRETILKETFKQSVRAINKDDNGREWLTDAQLEELYDAARNLSAKSLIEANKQALELLFEGKSVRHSETGEDKKVYLINFDPAHILENNFTAINQFRIDTPGRVKPMIIPDIVLFVNGLPIGVVECKVASEHAAEPMYEAITQLRRYSNQRDDTHEAGLKEGEERLFHFNQLFIATKGDEARYGSLTATEEYYWEWKEIWPEENRNYTPPLGIERSQEKLIQGMLDRTTLLDLIRHFTLFQPTDDGKRIIKVIARYPQYRAVIKIISRLRTGETPKERSGIIWHTQGSGKSLTMVFLVRKLRTTNDLRDNKVIMVNDRNDLETQLTETATLTGETVYSIENAKELKEKLATQASNLNMVMIHKFREAEGINLPEYFGEALGLTKGKGIPTFKPLGKVNASEKIIILIDEAHRTQFGDFGDNLFFAFPNATKIAFTGTPLLVGPNKQQFEKFGDYIDKYRLNNAVEDGATLRILYEGKAADGAVRDKDRFDRKFEDLFRDRTEEEMLAIRKKYGATGDILEAPALIDDKAKDMLEHYVEHIFPNGFKAQIVASSKKAAVLYNNSVRKALAEMIEREAAKATPDQTLLERLKFLKTAVVISSDGTNEKAEITAARAEAKKCDAVKNFKKSFDFTKENGVYKEPLTGIGIIVVCDMLLTGFDAPIEQVMYIDKKLYNHGLLQAIARVNRRRSGKTRGFVVDYIGLTDHLKDALRVYAGEEEDDTVKALRDISAEVPVLEERYQRLLALFNEAKITEIEAFVRQEMNDPAREVQLLHKVFEKGRDLKFRSDFEVYFKAFAESMDVILPNAAAQGYKVPLKRFGFLLAQVKEHFKDNTMSIAGAGEKVRKLINEHLVSLGINPKIPPVELFSPEFLQQVDKNKSERAKASEMEHAIRKHCKVHLNEDPVFYERLSEKLEAAIQRYHDNWEQLTLALTALRTEAIKGRETEGTGLSPSEAPFYDLIKKYGFDKTEVPAETDALLKEIASKIVYELKGTIGIVNFWGNDFEVKKLRSRIDDVLIFSGIDALADVSDKLVTEIVDLAKNRHSDLVK